MRNFISVLVFVCGLAAACSFGGWVMLIKPILAACAAFDAGTLTATIIGVTIIKCLFACVVFSLIVTAASFLANAISE